MYKKILSFVLAVMMVLSLGLVGVSAADEATGEVTDTKIYFELPEDWTETTKVYCHLWVYGGDSLASWQSKKEVCVDEGNGLYSYDTTKVGGLLADTWYGIIFSNNKANQTYDTLLTSDCLGATLYCDDTLYEGTQDSTKVSRAAFIRNMNPEVYGPVKQFTSLGNLIGTCLPPGVTDSDLFADFLRDWFDNVVTLTGESEQSVIDSRADMLGLTDDEVCELIVTSGKTIAWIGADGQNPAGPSSFDEATKDEAILGDANDDGVVNVKDATQIQKFTAGMYVFSDEQMLASNVNADEDVNVKDATYIQKWVAGSLTDDKIGVFIQQ